MNFECHITLTNPARFELATAIGKIEGFTFSRIDGDEHLGPGVKAYLTKSSNDLQDLLYDMQQTIERLELHDINWTRKKIECIILDDRKLT